jgi:hypothetical protein
VVRKRAFPAGISAVLAAVGRVEISIQGLTRRDFPQGLRCGQ